MHPAYRALLHAALFAPSGGTRRRRFLAPGRSHPVHAVLTPWCPLTIGVARQRWYHYNQSEA
jgi:hypothetical protein